MHLYTQSRNGWKGKGQLVKCLRSCNASSLNETAVHELTGEGKGMAFQKAKVMEISSSGSY